MDTNDNFLNGNGIIILILFFLMFGMNGGGWGAGNNALNNYATQADIQRGFDTSEITSKLDSIANGLCSSGYENAQLINGLNVSQMQSANGITQALNSGFDAVNANINDLGYKMQQCCCDLKTQMLQDKYEEVQTQLAQAQGVIANNVQTQNILNQLGRFYTYPAINPYAMYGGTTIA